MSTHLFEPERRLAILGRLIEALRAQDDRQGVALLATICKEIRATAPGHPDATIAGFEEQIRRVLESKTDLGYDQRKLAALGIEFMGRWPVMKAALQGMKERA